MGETALSGYSPSVRGSTPEPSSTAASPAPADRQRPRRARPREQPLELARADERRDVRERGRGRREALVPPVHAARDDGAQVRRRRR
jgi:hypothetical protein